MASIFTKIIDGDIPGHFVWQDDICVAFLDIEPLTTGHAMVVPRVEVDKWVELDAETRSHLFDVAARIGRAQVEVFDGERAGLIIQGFEVPHAHIHVFPTSSAADFDLGRRSSRSQEELTGDAERLRAALI